MGKYKNVSSSAAKDAKTVVKAMGASPRAATKEVGAIKKSIARESTKSVTAKPVTPKVPVKGKKK